jgi:hypothetical protein
VEIFAAIPGLVLAIEKGGVIASMLIMIIALVWEVFTTRKGIHMVRNDATTITGKLYNEVAIVTKQRDRALLTVMRLHTVCEAHKIKVSLDDIHDLIEQLMPHEHRKINNLS